MHQAAPNVEEIFFAALELESPEARSAFLDEACGDPELRRRVEQLLALDARANDFLEAPASIADGDRRSESRPGVEEPGTVIGPYKLLEQIGEGGMGVVYVAEQSQPVRRKVALKVIKPGMDSKQVVARFEAERQALAMMDHPNIAKVLDGGTTAVGPALLRHGAGPRPAHHRVLRPRAALDPRAAGAVRAGLPGRAARPPEGDHPPRPEALEHPGDAASTACRCPRSSTSASPRPPGRALTDKTLFTGFHQFVGTPLYMSPEQAELSGAGRRHPERHLLARACCSTSC